MAPRQLLPKLGIPVLLAILLAFPLLDSNPYHVRAATSAALYVVLVLGLNVVVGQAGLLDLGYIGFYAIGAYTCALLASPHLGIHISFWMIIPLAVLLAALAGVVLGVPVLRLKGDYLAIVTLGFGEIIRILLTNLDRPFNLTNGPNGIVRIDPPRLGGYEVTGPATWYLLIVGLALLTYYVYLRLDRSRAGLAWKALRDDQLGAQACGIDIVKYKLAAFAVGAAIAGAAGAFFASWQGAVFPQTFSMGEIVTIFCMMVLGGVGNPAGAVVGAAALVILPELLRAYSSYRMLIYGVLLVAMMQMRPGGLIPARSGAARSHLARGIQGSRRVAPGSLAPGGSQTSRDRDALTPTEPAQALRAEQVSVPPEPVLIAENIKKRFGGVKALDGVSLQLRPGEVLAVIGPNGAGKSTLLDIISGYQPADEGRVLLGGDGRGQHASLLRVSPHRIARWGLARTFQNPRVFLSLTPEENLAAGLFASTDGRARPATLGEVFPSLFAGSSRPDPGLAASSLTYADRRKLEVTRALAGNPRILMLDEPAAGMSDAEVRELCHAIKSLAHSGLGVLLIEHRMEVVRRCAHRVLAIAEGRPLAEGEPEEVLSDPTVVSSYLGDNVSSPAVRPLSTGGPHLTSALPHRPDDVLTVRGLDAGYGAKAVLASVDLAVGRGELVCLLGANGAGKSTLLKAIFGLTRIFRGQIDLSGQSIVGRPPDEIVRAGVALVPEGRRIFARLTVKENLELGVGPARARPRFSSRNGESAEWHAGHRQQLQEAMEKVLELFPRLRERLHQPAGNLSGGEQQMLAMARALVSRPRLLCLDEPTMGLSPRLATAVLEHVREINSLGTAVLLVEQAARAAARLTPRTYVLREGKVAYEGVLDTPDVLEHIERIYLR